MIEVYKWANMVHFIKHVGWSLEMVVSQEGLFTKEGVGLGREDKQANKERQMMLEESRGRRGGRREER